jgi:hypothetical protein
MNFYRDLPIFIDNPSDHLRFIEMVAALTPNDELDTMTFDDIERLNILSGGVMKEQSECSVEFLDCRYEFIYDVKEYITRKLFCETCFVNNFLR